ncbi:hypothetical protein [Burkholderia pseudomallei]|uniref:hypothetical protein n=1 Tax=Burkholderia pseudomallei TaxID=28450 RepID=UPI001AD759C7|nr:hypothetical protein [Burkholderia pseudomallei]MBO7752338.1 hypothetical protein [Burkholderia pseudomallei]
MALTVNRPAAVPEKLQRLLANDKRVRLSIDVTADKLRRLKIYCATSGKSQSQVVNEEIDALLAKARIQ